MENPLSEVTEGIYQVSDLDVAILSLVEGDRGVIVIDPLSEESTAGALGRYRARRGDRPVTGVIYTHSQGDPLGGVTDVDVPILAPAGLLGHAVSDVARTGQEETVDGVRIVFQLGSGMNLLLPRRRALFMARNAGHSSHHVLTEAIALFGSQADVLFASHRPPMWGRPSIMRYLSEQRDVQAYLHDQTLRLLNRGHTGTEIAELIQLPPVLEKAWHDSGFPGSVAHSVTEIYQRHLGRFDGNGLWPHPPASTARRYVESLGGVSNLVTRVREFVDSGDLRFAAFMLQHAVLADPGGDGVRDLLARVYERLGHDAGDATWREFYFTSARELRYGVTLTPAAALSLEQIFDTVAIRVDARTAWHENIAIDWVLEGAPYRTTLRHGVLIHHPRAEAISERADLTLTLAKAELLGLLAGQGLDGIHYEGDPEALKRMLSHLDSSFVGVA